MKYYIGPILVILGSLITIGGIATKYYLLAKVSEQTCRPFAAMGSVNYNGKHFVVCDSPTGPVVREGHL